MKFVGMSSAQLVTLYNQNADLIGEKHVKRFSDRGTAVKRTAKLMARVANKQPKTKQRAAARRRGFNFPVRAGGPKAVREDTSRAQLVALLSQGATFEDCVKLAGFKDERNTYQAIRLLHTYCGFGLKQGEDGIIHLVTS